MTSQFCDQFNGSDSVENAVMSVDNCFPSSDIVDNNSDRGFHCGNISYYVVGPQRILVILTHPAKLYFNGALYVECISGVVNIHGYSLKYGNGRYLVLSGYGQSAMCFSTETASCDLLIHCSHDLPIDYVLKFEKYKLFKIPSNNNYSYFEKLENRMGCMFDISSGDRIPLKMQYDPSLRALAGDCFNLKVIDPKVMICGGKGVGKSTSLQYLVNSMLGMWSAVVIIDFDIGQPDFSFPGCMSVVLVQKPILSPNFNNIYQPLRSIVVGHVDLNKCLTTYFNAVEELHKFCVLNREIIHLPWVMNTMSFIEGFSLPIISKINFLFSPTHVLEIKSLTEPSLNVLPLTPGNMKKMIEFSIQQCNFPHFEDNLRVPDNYSLSSIPALKLNNPIFIPPRASREIMISLHMIFRGILRESCITTVSLDYKSQKEIRSFYKSKIVAICKAYGRRSFMQCIGFGVVLARHGNKVSFQTPLKEDILLDPEGFDIFALDLGLGNSLWDELNLSYPNRKQFKDMIALKN